MVVDMSDKGKTNDEQQEQLKQQQILPAGRVLTVKKLKGCDSKSVSSTATGGTDMAFFASTERGTYSNSHSWKSSKVKLDEDFARVERNVRRIAPQQFRNPAKPTYGPCDIVPITALKYHEHTLELMKMVLEQKQRNATARKEASRVINIKAPGEAQQPIKSHFGVNAKIYSSGFSPVLCKPTMWSLEYVHLNVEPAEWPSLAQLQDCGDKRENDKVPTRCGRYLPSPQHMVTEYHTFDEAGNAIPTRSLTTKKLMPLDEHGPIFQYGPSPVEVTQANTDMDNGASFEQEGRLLLGEDLMEEIGEWKAPFVPDWLRDRRQ